MSIITKVSPPNLWDDICKALATQRPPFRDHDTESVHTVLEDFDPAKHNPVFYGKLHKKIDVDCDAYAECDPSVCHPSLAGYALVDKPPKSPPPPPPPLPDLKKCSPRNYLETYIFPVLLPALEEMLKEAKTEKCFERKRTKFSGLDFLTVYLYTHNSKYDDREDMELGDIPFVKEHWKDHPRPPLPKSLLWTEAEAVLIIQAFWRGYKVRCDPEIQELRVWQRQWQEENANIQNKVSDFWAKKMPEGEEDGASGSAPASASGSAPASARGLEKDPVEGLAMHQPGSRQSSARTSGDDYTTPDENTQELKNSEIDTLLSAMNERENQVSEAAN